MDSPVDRLNLERRMATLEMQYRQLFDLLERHNSINEKLEVRLDRIDSRIGKLGWTIAFTLLSVIASFVLSLIGKAF